MKETSAFNDGGGEDIQMMMMMMMCVCVLCVCACGEVVWRNGDRFAAF